ncbi:peptidylprolyl isomerase [Nonlabens tegetincola]|uniref:peptidylprolyl isomerase n=1 Tax=Nonlabens tegetincola TaxID=323273 RepID=UPI0030C7BB00
MKSLYCICLIVFFYSCKDTPVTLNEVDTPSKESNAGKWITKEEKEERRLEKIYTRAVSAKGDTLLHYIPQDSVPLFFKRYGKKNPETRVLLSTKYGDVTFELFKETELYRSSFIYLIKNGYFNQTVFHRVVDDFIVQGGNSDDSYPSLMRNSSGNYQLPPHFLDNVKHERGTLSMAKSWDNNPDNWHNAFDFFITLKKAEHLDGEHTIFGRVVEGMEVLERISQIPTDSRDWPEEDVYMTFKVLKE